MQFYLLALTSIIQLKNKIYRLSFEFSDLKKIVDLLVWNKFFESGTMTDIEFMSSNQKIKDRYI
ncbi:hypothetical protein [Spiroplasma endosymbiont of Tipula paludosa]|uniref:hypothetical protein n=1 Tax=Spiroplasma endosymbiont of Tipula paludosa TaxID=3066295 RepID=UPI0035C8869C